jgi:acrylyl-CoA reductase (NADPH)
MKTCKAYRIFEDGRRSAGRLTEVAPEELDGGELLIRATYSSINYKDALAATGTGKVVRSFPLVGGIDVAGVVEASSDGRFEEGDKVLVTGFGMGEDHDGATRSGSGSPPTGPCRSPMASTSGRQWRSAQRGSPRRSRSTS